MGEHVNKTWNNVIGWSAVAILIVLSLMLLVMPLFT
jgi:Mn2+/Fe2+ NRAMP family transporter